MAGHYGVIDFQKEVLTYTSKKQPVTNAVQVSPSFSLLFRYSTVLFFPAKYCGRMAIAFSLLVSLPNSLGMKRFTPALTAASMMCSCCLAAAVAMVETMASWPYDLRGQRRYRQWLASHMISLQPVREQRAAGETFSSQYSTYFESCE